jgi:hypothetical protein
MLGILKISIFKKYNISPRNIYEFNDIIIKISMEFDLWK